MTPSLHHNKFNVLQLDVINPKQGGGMICQSKWLPSWFVAKCFTVQKRYTICRYKVVHTYNHFNSFFFF